MHIYEVMAEPIRRRIVETLASGAHYAGDLEDLVTHEFGVGRSAVQHHLKLLRDHDFVTVHDEWPYRSYELGEVVLRRLKSELRHLEQRWRQRIGWRTKTDPLAAAVRPSKRGRRGRGLDPDDTWPIA